MATTIRQLSPTRAPPVTTPPVLASTAEVIPSGTSTSDHPGF
jgi:hypothetical protein